MHKNATNFSQCGSSLNDYLAFMGQEWANRQVNYTSVYICGMSDKIVNNLSIPLIYQSHFLFVNLLFELITLRLTFFYFIEDFDLPLIFFFAGIFLNRFPLISHSDFSF